MIRLGDWYKRRSKLGQTNIEAQNRVNKTLLTQNFKSPKSHVAITWLFRATASC